MRVDGQVSGRSQSSGRTVALQQLLGSSQSPRTVWRFCDMGAWMAPRVIESPYQGVSEDVEGIRV